ncbi:MAG: hypothetical protein KAH17_10480, partial [Bacteroidales bacterium]|nr:hypothetical protein [Bacteroidales bacterium]
MKKFTLLLSLFFIVTVSYGQKLKINPNVKPVDRVLYDHPTFEKSSFKGEGEVFFSETFDFADASDERGWSPPEGWQIVDDGDNGTFWTWRAGTDSIKGNYTFEPGHIYSLTPDDGYFVLPMDEYNHADGGSTDFSGPSWFQMP